MKVVWTGDEEITIREVEFQPGEAVDLAENPSLAAKAIGIPGFEEVDDQTIDLFDATETDVHGMTWDESLHAAPPVKNGDGSWRAARGKGDENDAAVKAHLEAISPND